jgi:hypothetical protein
VRSLDLDNWEPKVIEFMQGNGNEKGNRLWEHHTLPNFTRPSETATMEEREKYIKAKYVEGLFRTDHPEYVQQLGKSNPPPPPYLSSFIAPLPSPLSPSLSIPESPLPSCFRPFFFPESSVD